MVKFDVPQFTSNRVKKKKKKKERTSTTECSLDSTKNPAGKNETLRLDQNEICTVHLYPSVGTLERPVNHKGLYQG